MSDFEAKHEELYLQELESIAESIVTGKQIGRAHV